MTSTTHDHAPAEANAFESELAEAAELMRTDSASACSRLQSLLQSAQQREVPAEVAEYAYLFARGRLLQGNLTQALDLIDLAKTSWVDLGEVTKAARTDLGRMNVLDDLGQHEQSIDVGRGLLRQLGTSDDPHEIWIRAAALKNLGISHGYLGLHEEALHAYTQAELLYQSIGELDDMALAMANRGVELLELGNADEAIRALRQAAISLSTQGDQLSVAKCLAYEAQAQLRSGDYLACSAATDSAAELLGDQHATVEFARIELVRAHTLRSINKLDEAIELYTTVVALFRTEGLDHDHAASLLGLAGAYAKAGDRESARAAFEQSGALYVSVGDSGQAAVADIGLSELLDSEDARPIARAALATLRETRRPAELAAALLRCARLETEATVALNLLDELETVVRQHQLPEFVWRQLHERGMRYRSQGDLLEALEALRSARESIDAMRSTIDRDDDRAPFMQGRDIVHTDSIRLLLELGRDRDAWDIVQHERSRTLVEVMRGELERAHTLDPPSELDGLYSELLYNASPSSTSSWLRVRELEATSHTASVRSEPTAPAQADLGTVVTYQVLDNEVLAFIVDSSGTRVVRNLTTTEQLRILQSRLEAQWRRFDDPGLAARHQTNLLTTVIQVLQHLHIALVAPLDVLEAPSLMIVPQGTMANIPFGSLHDGTCHLIERMPVTIAPSAPVAAQAHARLRPRPNRRRLVVGVESAETPSVAREVALLAAHGDTTVLRDDEATIAGFMNEAAHNDILHIASHGIHRPDNPIFSAIQFSDRWLTAGEISGMQLDGQIVILSACSTGRQAGHATSNELDGLPRALLAAGAGAVAVNLWPVDDNAAAQLMGRFHDHLSSHTAAAALRAAQQDIMTTSPHPYYWGSTVILGASDHTEVYL